MNRGLLNLMMMCAATVALVSCGKESSKTEGGNEPQKPVTEIRMSGIPDTDAAKLKDRFDRVATWLSSKVGVKVTYLAQSDYKATVTGLVSDKLDLVWYGAVTAVQAEKQAMDLGEGVTFVACRDVDMAFKTYYIANSKLGIKKTDKIEDLKEAFKGKTFTFGSTNSTSGHFMPHYFLIKAGMAPRDLFKTVAYQKNHDETLRAVAGGQIDVGALNFASWEKAGDELKANAPVVCVSPTYVDYVFGAHNRLGSELIEKIRAAFVGLNTDSDPTAKDILQSFSAKEKFVAADAKAWEVTRDVMNVVIPETLK